MVDGAPRLQALNSPAPVSGRKRAYSEDFKRDAVAMARGGKSVAQVARTVGVARATLRQWIADAPPAPTTMLEAVQSGDRRAFLRRARDRLATAIDEGVPSRELLPMIRALEEYLQELQTIEELEEDGDGEPE